MDTTPLWLIAIFAVIAILLWIALELRQARKYGRQKYYNFSISNGQLNEKAQADRVDFLNPNKFPLSEETDEPIKLAFNKQYGKEGL